MEYTEPGTEIIAIWFQSHWIKKKVMPGWFACKPLNRLCQLIFGSYKHIGLHVNVLIVESLAM